MSSVPSRFILNVRKKLGRVEIANHAIPTLPQPDYDGIIPFNHRAYGVRILRARSLGSAYWTLMNGLNRLLSTILCHVV